MIRGSRDLVTELNSGSDRGLIILGATFVEAVLDEVLEAIAERMHSEARSRFYEIANNLHKKAGLAFAFGGISKRDYDALETVRMLRNLVAHEVVDFSDDRTVELSAKLVRVLKGFPTNISGFLANSRGSQLGRILAGVDDSALKKVQRVTFLIATLSLFMTLMARAVDVDEWPASAALKDYDNIEQLFRKFEAE